MLYVLVLLCIVLLGVVILIGMACAIRLNITAQLEAMSELHEADKEIILAVDRIEDELGTVKPKKGGGS